MAFRSNVIANYCSAFFTAVLPIWAIPYFLKYLGVAQWGLISFISVLVGMLSLLEAGLSQALSKEFSDRLNENTNFSAANLLYSFELIYFTFSLVIGLIVVVFSTSISSTWLNVEDINTHYANYAVIAAGVMFFLQLPASLYRSVLMSKSSQIEFNIIVSIITLLRYIGGVGIVIFNGSFVCVLVWFVFCSFLDVVIKAKITWIFLEIKRHSFKWDYKVIEPIIKFFVKMIFGTLLGALAVQLDKIIVVKLLPISDFAYYSISVSLAMGYLQLIYPITNTLLPNLVRCQGDDASLRKENLRALRLISVMIVLGWCVFYLFGMEALSYWLEDKKSVNIVFSLFFFLFIGTSFNAVYGIGLANWIASGKVRNVIILNAMQLLCVLAILPIMIYFFGLIGATAGWVALNLIGIVFSSRWLRNIF